MRKYPAVWLLGLIAVLVAGFCLRTNYSDKNTCVLPYGRFIHVPLDFKSANSKVNRNYALYYFREWGVSLNFENIERDAHLMGGTPVLFIPGNAGSYKQGRALASLAAHERSFDWFLADFDEDLSAMHGRTLIDESRYINDAIDYILNLYEQKRAQMPQRHKFVLPKSVIIVAHSMGGIVARTLVSLDNYRKDSINTVITLSAPHAYPPITFDRDLTQLYDLVGQFWRSDRVSDIALVSLNGGHSDLMVLPDMTSVNSLDAISVQTYEIPGVERGIDHIAVMWCGELREKIIAAISEIADHPSPERTVSKEARMSVFERRFKVPIAEQLVGTDAPVVSVGHNIMLGRTSRHTISAPTQFVLPSKSSLVSYKVSADKSINLAQRTPNPKDAYRNYGNRTAPTTLMWYAAGPYVPQAAIPQLIALVEPFETTIVEFAVDWPATLTNILLHYRTLAACWPFFFVLLCFLSHVRSSAKLSFAQTLVNVVTDKWFYALTAVFIMLHVLLLSPSIRWLVRLFQFPSERHNIASLRSVGYSVHDLFLGLYEPMLFWVAPVLLAVANLFLCAVCLVSVAIVRLRTRVWPVKAAEKARPLRLNIAMLAKIVVLCSVLYFVPYQVSTLMLAVWQLLQVADTDSFEFAFSQLLIWASVVDAPVLAVWVRNLNWEWIWGFATIWNIASVLPIAMYVLSGAPKRLEFHSRLSRNLTVALLAYMTMYTVLYAGLHGFMLHHLINYFALWLLVLEFEG